VVELGVNLGVDWLEPASCLLSMLIPCIIGMIVMNKNTSDLKPRRLDPAPLWYWIRERHRIYIRRFVEKRPQAEWTCDPILRDYRFCNVFRELDRVTIWIRENIRERWHHHRNLWFLLCIARQINWPPTLYELFDETTLPHRWDPREVYDVLESRRARGLKVYTGAYMLRGDTGHKFGKGFVPKVHYTVFGVLDPLYRQFQRDCGVKFGKDGPDTIQGWTEYLMGFEGWGGFLAYEVATDLRHTRYLCNAKDINTWANAGPGAKRGLNRLAGVPVKRSLQDDLALVEMRHLLSLSRRALPAWVPKLELRDIEHSLCETDKYLRAKLGEGNLRSRYKYSLYGW